MNFGIILIYLWQFQNVIFSVEQKLPQGSFDALSHFKLYEENSVIQKTGSFKSKPEHTFKRNNRLRINLDNIPMDNSVNGVSRDSGGKDIKEIFRNNEKQPVHVFRKLLEKSGLIRALRRKGSGGLIRRIGLHKSLGIKRSTGNKDFKNNKSKNDFKKFILFFGNVLKGRVSDTHDISNKTMASGISYKQEKIAKTILSGKNNLEGKTELNWSFGQIISNRSRRSANYHEFINLQDDLEHLRQQVSSEIELVDTSGDSLHGNKISKNIKRGLELKTNKSKGATDDLEDDIGYVSEQTLSKNTSEIEEIWPEGFQEYRGYHDFLGEFNESKLYEQQYIKGKHQIKDIKGDIKLTGLAEDRDILKMIDVQFEDSNFLSRFKRQVPLSKKDEDSSKIPTYVPSIGAVLNIIFKRLEILDKLTNVLEMKMGTKGRPARTCKDIYLEFNKNVTSNLYWLDPNQGSKTDAILAECKFKDNDIKTCISVKTSSRGRPLTKYVKTSNTSDGWVSKIKDTNGKLPKKVVYMASYSQLAFLQQLHSKAEQTIDIMCQRSVAYFDNLKRNYELALQLKAFNDKILHSHVDKRIKSISGVNILEIKVKDDCMERMEVPTSAQFIISSKDTQYLPITDIKFSDFGRPDQLIGYYFEGVCFS